MQAHRLLRSLAAVILSLAFALIAPTALQAVGVGKICGGIRGIACDKGLWCQFPTGQCKVADAQGKCIKVPQICTKIYRPVCGCDNKTYGNDCERQAAMVQKAHNGKCK